MISCQHQWVNVMEFGQADPVMVICEICGAKGMSDLDEPGTVDSTSHAGAVRELLEMAVRELLEMARALAPDATPPPGS